MDGCHAEKRKASLGLKVVFAVVTVCCFLGACLNLRPTASKTAMHGFAANKSVLRALESSYELAYEQSFGYFDDITEVHWKLYQQRAKNEPMYHEPNPDPATMPTAAWLVQNVDPIFTCAHICQAGGRGDGPKWTCDPHRLPKQPNCLIYSIGSSGDYAFEDGLVKALGTHCEIHVFDPDPSFGRKNDAEKRNIWDGKLHRPAPTAATWNCDRF
jgi:Methyltransferase domain